MRLTFDIFPSYFFLVLSFSLINSCQVEECPCVSSSQLNGRWIGRNFSQIDTIELEIYLNEKNSNIFGSGNLYIYFEGYEFEFFVTCRGNFVSDKITLNFQGADSLYYEGLYISKLDSISGNLFFSKRKLPFGLKKVK